MNVGIVWMKVLNMLLSLFAFFRSLITLHTLRILMTENPSIYAEGNTAITEPASTIEKSKIFQLSLKY